MHNMPLNALVILIGPSRAGKTTFAEKYFKPHEVISFESLGTELTGELDNSHLRDFIVDEFHRRIETKLKIGERVVVDALNLRKRERMAVTNIGSRLQVPVYYIVLNRTIEEKQADGGDMYFVNKTEETFKGQEKDILKGDGLATVIDTRITTDEGAKEITVIEKIDYTNFARSVVDNGYNTITIIGDVHGMTDDFKRIVRKAINENSYIIQLGDVVDYGPDAIGSVDLMYRLVMNGQGSFIIGNHERKLERYFKQKREGNIRLEIKGGLVETLKQYESLNQQKQDLFERRFMALMNHARHHMIMNLADETLMFVHGATNEHMWNIYTPRLKGANENRAVFGEVDPHQPTREDGYPSRIYNWVDAIPENHTVYVGHDIRDMENIHIKNGKLGGQAVFTDTGSGKGGKLSFVKRELILPK